MAESESGQERTEQPTPRRLQQARDKGQVARSRELASAAVVTAGAGGLALFGPALAEGLAAGMREALLRAGEPAGQTRLALALGEGIGPLLLPMLALLGLLVVVAIGASVAIGGLAVSGKALAPKPDKLNPVAGLKRIFAVRGLVELLKALGKFAIVGSVAVAVLWSLHERVLLLGRLELEPGAAAAASLFALAFAAIAAGLWLIAALDVPYQLWEHGRQLRMTRQEVRDELKETEGRPEVKARIRGLQRELSQRRMLEAVPAAAAVIVNPVHVAVALRYEADMAAPEVVAKGRGEVALKIRELARSHRVPIVSAPPLARALYRQVELGERIPAGLYVAVAQILAYVHQLRVARRARRRPPALPRPQLPAAYAEAARELED
ncbi:MAG: flagellar biosynthesis protein FlhB [Pseudomonadota bacterium]|nr:flagellar biosynthesis protein FlhB [Pseudomonadota bacterium]